MSTTTTVKQKGQTCAHYGCGCRVTDEAYCSRECESVASGQTGSPSVPAPIQTAKAHISSVQTYPYSGTFFPAWVSIQSATQTMAGSKAETVSKSKPPTTRLRLR